MQQASLTPNNMKKIPCWLRLHGQCTEIPVNNFESMAADRKFVKDIGCFRPFTIVKITEDDATRNHVPNKEGHKDDVGV